jgi:hypothetical protein
VFQTTATRLLDIPLVVTEQYPKGLGNTVPELDISNAVCKVAKTRFSMDLPEVQTALKSVCDGKAQHVVLFGIEVCVFKFIYFIYLFFVYFFTYVFIFSTSSLSLTFTTLSWLYFVILFYILFYLFFFFTLLFIDLWFFPHRHYH